jgi:hypothetical protein
MSYPYSRRDDATPGRGKSRTERRSAIRWRVQHRRKPAFGSHLAKQAPPTRPGDVVIRGDPAGTSSDARVSPQETCTPSAPAPSLPAHRAVGSRYRFRSTSVMDLDGRVLGVTIDCEHHFDQLEPTRTRLVWTVRGRRDRPGLHERMSQPSTAASSIGPGRASSHGWLGKWVVRQP